MGTLKDLLARTLKPGATVGGQYQLQRRVGQGGFGEVWLALDQRNHTTVALKMMPHQWARLPEIQASLTQECVVLKTLAHPHICRVLDLVQDATYGPLLVTEWVDGVDCVAATRDATFSTCWSVLVQILAALSYLHGRGILHLDIKPANVLVGTEGVKLIDFGLATVAAPKTGAGTWAYMAPERIRGDAIDARADLYAVGVLLYECLTGSNPFQAPQPEVIHERQLVFIPPPVSSIRPDCPTLVDRLLTTLLAKQPTERYPSAKAVLQELQLVLGDTAVRQAMGQTTAQVFATAAGQFIGRQEVIEPLRGAWERAAATTPAIHWVPIRGGSGLGKSRLLRELKFTAQLAGCRTAWFDAAADATPLAIQSLAEGLTRPLAPLALCLDDYDQWGNDPDAHRLSGFLETLATHPHPPTSIWCLTTGKTSLNVMKQAISTHYALTPFTNEELAAYVRAVAPVPRVQLPSLVAQLQQYTAGIPAHVATVMDRVVARGDLATAAGQWEERLFADITVDLPEPVVAHEAEGIDSEIVLTLCRHDRATGHAGRALARLTTFLSTVCGDAPTRAPDDFLSALAIEAAECALTIGRPHVGYALVEQCLNRCPDHEGALRLWQGILRMAQRDYGGAREPLQRGLARAEQQHDQVLICTLRNQLARCALLQQRYDEAIEGFRTTRTLAGALPKTMAAQIINNELGHALLLAGHLDEAIEVLTEEMVHCRAAGATRRALQARLWRAECWRLLGKWQTAVPEVESVVHEARRQQFLPLLAEAHNGLGMLYCARGQSADGLAAYEQAQALAYCLRDLATVSIVTTNLGLAYLRRGKITTARHAFETVLAFLGQQPEQTVIERAAVPTHLGLAEIARQEEQYVAALGHLTTAEALATQHRLTSQYQFPLVLTRGEVARDQHQWEIARQRGLAAQPYIRTPEEQRVWQEFMDSLPHVSPAKPDR